MMSPEQFHRQYYGYNVDYDGVAGKQCVDLAKKHFAIAGIPKPADPIGGDGYADNIWYYKKRYLSRYNAILPSQGFQNGDMVIFPHKERGGWTHPFSHVCFWYDGKEFGMNQGGDRSACDKHTDWSDALGALRLKEWDKMIESKIGHNEVVYDGPTTSNIKIMWERGPSAKGYSLYYLQAGDSATSLDHIDKIGSDQLLIIAKGGNTYYQMDPKNPIGDPVGTHYGIEVDGRINQYCQTREKNPNVIVFYEDRNGDCHVMTANEFNLEPGEINFAVTPYAVRIHRGLMSYYRSSEYGDRDDYATDQSFWMKIGNDWCIGVAENCVPRDISAFGMECGAEELVIMDSGGSAQLLGWDFDHQDKMLHYKKKDRAVSGTGVLAVPIANLIQNNVKPVAVDNYSQPDIVDEQPSNDVIPYKPKEETSTTEPAVFTSYNGQTLAEKLSSRKMWAAIIPFLVGLFIKFGVEESLASNIGSIILLIVPPIIYMCVEAYVDKARARGADIQKLESMVDKLIEQINKQTGGES